MQTNSTKILVSLDCLLDTRLSLLASIDEDLALKELKNNYHYRRSDKFEGLSIKEFRDLYKKRDREVLTKSMMTNMVYFLKEITDDLIKEGLTNPLMGQIGVDINYFPYSLSEEEKLKLSQVIAYRSKITVPINFVNYTDHELSPQFIKNNYKILIFYDYENWLEVNTDNFKSTLLGDVDLLVPAISFTDELTDERIKELKDNNNGLHPFDQIKLLFAGLIKIEFIDVAAYSILNR